MLPVSLGRLARADVVRTIPPSWSVPPAYTVLLGSGREGSLLLVVGYPNARAERDKAGAPSLVSGLASVVVTPPQFLGLFICSISTFGGHCQVQGKPTAICFKNSLCCLPRVSSPPSMLCPPDVGPS